jgi:methionyl-tRNA formyltransferase
MRQGNCICLFKNAYCISKGLGAGCVKIDAMQPHIIFMGSPEFALPTLRQLNERYHVVGVVTQPDRPAGRGRVLSPPPIKTLANSLGLPVIQPRRLGEPQAMQQLRKWRPDLIVVTAFGQILKSEVLELPGHGCINVHASLLPRWRGAAPIQAAILHGDAQSGVTIMRMDPGLDTGPILSQRAITITPDDTAESLGDRLAQLGAELLMDTLPAYVSGKIEPKAQDEGLATYAPMLNKEAGHLDFRQPVESLERQVRAFNPWPGAFMTWQGKYLKIHQAHVQSTQPPSREPGATLVIDGLPAIATVDGLLILDDVQPAGKKAMPAKIFLNGAKGWGEPLSE